MSLALKVVKRSEILMATYETKADCL